MLQNKNVTNLIFSYLYIFVTFVTFVTLKKLKKNCLLKHIFPNKQAKKNLQMEIFFCYFVTMLQITNE
jgi:hypothetical protein